jgi:hypothetical protein
LGLRLRARSRGRALTQWGAVLAGEAAETAPGELTFRWPESSMRIVVAVDAEGDEGPLAIEYTSDRTAALPDGKHPVLGVVLRRV